MRRLFWLGLILILVFGCKHKSEDDVSRDVLPPKFESPEEIAYSFAEKYYRHVALKEELKFEDYCVPEIIPMLKLEIPYLWSGRKVTQEMRDGYEFIVKKDITKLEKDGDEVVVTLFYTEYRDYRESESNDGIEIRVIKDKNGRYRISSYIGELGWIPDFYEAYMKALRNGGDPEAVLRERKEQLDWLREKYHKDSLELEMLREQRKKNEELTPYHSYGLNRDEIRRWALDNCVTFWLFLIVMIVLILSFLLYLKVRRW